MLGFCVRVLGYGFVLWFCVRVLCYGFLPVRGFSQYILRGFGGILSPLTDAIGPNAVRN